MRRIMLPMTIILITLTLQGWAYFETVPSRPEKVVAPRRLNLKRLAPDQLPLRSAAEAAFANDFGGETSSRSIRNGIPAKLNYLRTTAVYQGDLDGDQKKDVVVYAAPSQTRGLDADNRWVNLYLQRESGGFRKISFWSYHGEIKDFLDMNGDGRYEVVILSLSTINNKNYWAYHLFELVGGKLQPCHGQYEGFPLYIDFTSEIHGGTAVKVSRHERAIDAQIISESIQYQTIIAP